MTYVKQVWANTPSVTSPLSADRLNHLETQFDEATQYTDQKIAENPGQVGPKGDPGTPGAEGPQGPSGEAAVISAATVSTLPAGAEATVTMGGTSSNRTFNFGVPQGAQGIPGPAGADGTSVQIRGTLPGIGSLPESGAPGDAWMISGNLWVWTGSDWENVGPIQGPKGDPGADGAQGPRGEKGVDGAPGDQGPQGVQGPKGDRGSDGVSATISSSSASKLPAGSQPTVSLGGTPTARTFAFGIPEGAKGVKGDKGEQGNPTSVNGKSGPSITLTAADLGAASENTTALTVAPGLNGVPADGSGDAGAALTALLNSLPSGSQIEARPGDVYNLASSVIVDKPVTIRGGTWLHHVGTASFQVTSSDVTFENLNMVGPALDSNHPASSRFILAKGTQSAPIERLTISGSSFTNCAHTALRLDWCKDLEVTSNVIRNVHYAGIMMDSANRGIVSDNIIRNVVQGGTLINSYGIAVSDSGNVESARSRDVIVRGNLIDGVLKWEGIDTHGGFGILVLGNTLRSCRYPISIVVGNPSRSLAPQGCIVQDNVIVRGSAPDEARAISFVGLNGDLLSDGVIGVNTIRGYSQDLHLDFNDPKTTLVLPQSTDATVRTSPTPAPFRSWARIIEMTIPANSPAATSRAIPFPAGYFTQTPAILASASTNSPNKLSTFTTNASTTGFTLGCVVTDGGTSSSPRVIKVSTAAFQMDSGTGLTPGV